MQMIVTAKRLNKRSAPPLALSDNNIVSLYELPDGKMWVMTMGGPCIYDSHTEKFDANYDGYLHALGLPSGYGIAKDKLYHTYQVLGAESVAIGSLNSLQKYYFTIDAFNENGVAKGKNIIEVK